jgi:PKD repeat protein
LAAGYWAKDDLLKYIPAFGGGKQAVTKENQIPVAKFTLSKNKVYVGDKIDFVCEASDPDIGDKVASYEWSVSRNNDMFILFSRDQNPSYTFDAEGDYIVSLIVKDTTRTSSNAYKVGFKVLPKEEIPEGTGNNGPNDIRK